MIQRELQSLTEAEILTSERRGRQRFYIVNRKHPIFKDLRNIIFKTDGVIDKIREALKPLAEKIKVALVYGSFARGEEVSGSDLDLFVIGSPGLDDIVSSLSAAKRAIGREINPSLLSDAEFEKKFLKKNHFVRSVVKSDKEFMIGTEDELRELSGDVVSDKEVL